MILDGGRWTALMCENHSGMETNTGKNMVHVKTALRENHSGMGGEDPPVAFGGQYHFVAPVRLRRASSASRAKNEEQILCSFEGRVHDLGRRTVDGSYV